MAKPILAWHFCAGDKAPALSRYTIYGTRVDGDPVVVGEWLTVVPPIVPCKRGLHGSLRAIDALHYAPGEWVCRTEHDGAIVAQDDKLASERRRCLWYADATETLRAFARWCALDVIHLWDAPDVVKRYLETGDKSLRSAARAAAQDAAWDRCNDQLTKMLLALEDNRG